MADISITASAVLPGSGARTRHVTAGATITAGQVVYREASTGKYKLADTDSATAEVRTPAGIALNGASDGQPLTILTQGLLTLNAVLTQAVAYYLSGTAGGICPVADVASGDYTTVIGVAQSSTVLNVNFTEAGAALA